MAETKARHIANLVEDDGDVKSAHLDNITVTPTAVSDQANTSTGYLDVPSGTTAQRPTLDNAGGTRFNTTTGSLEFYDGTNWVSTNLIPNINSITGTIYAGLSGRTLTLSVSNTTDTIDVKYYEGGTLIATDDGGGSGVTVTNGSATSTVPSAVYNQTAGDTIRIQVFNVDGTPSSNYIDKTVVGVPSGGDSIVEPSSYTGGGYRSHTFLTGGTFTNTIANLSVEYLLVAGGGGGGGGSTVSSLGGGGGGAGGMKTGTATLSAQGYTITVGPGGSGAVTDASGTGTNGGSSSAFSDSVTGGGGGGTREGTQTGANGGSGGGGSGNANDNGGLGTLNQGHDGGDADSGWGAGGGGGKGAAANNVGSSDTSTAGGAGATNNYRTGSNITYAGGGGGGGTYNSQSGASGGSGGGGAGGGPVSGGTTGGDGTDGLGGGGGGSAWANTSTNSGPTRGGHGGDGIVVIRYQLP